MCVFDFIFFFVLKKLLLFIIFFVLLETTKKQNKKYFVLLCVFFFPFSKYHPVLLFIVDRTIVIESCDVIFCPLFLSECVCVCVKSLTRTG